MLRFDLAKLKSCTTFALQIWRDSSVG
jgi:hypothetical protein